jgi:hypothetical protein
MLMLRRRLKERPAARKQQPAISTPAAGMLLTFRAEVMPGRETDQRTFEVARVLTSGRIELANLQGEHALTEFESLPG